MRTRNNYLALALIIIMAFIFLRLAQLQIQDTNFLQKQSSMRTQRLQQIPAFRGNILDRNGEALAVSTKVKSIWINPLQVQDEFDLIPIAKLLNLSFQQVSEKIQQNSQKSFLYLKRHISPDIADTILALKVVGVYAQDEYKRYYPTQEVGAHIIGFTDTDEVGIEGVELKYNSWLNGTVGQQLIQRDRMGRNIANLGVVQEAVNGNDLQLSIDQRLQYLAYTALQESVQTHGAKSGSAVVVDVDTFEVLAMVNQPSYNPNYRHRGEASNLYRNRAVTDAFEPASVLKVFSMASILEHSDFTPDSMVNTAPGFLRLQGGTVRDIHNHGMLDGYDILQKSSNVGISKLILASEPKNLWDTFDRLGFGWTSQSGFPGENPGVLHMPRQEQEFVTATMAFGYGVSVTNLQLARAFAILGSKGIRRPISFIKQDEAPEGLRVMNSEVARQLVEMLANAVNTVNSNAKVPGYRVAGKTGTARQIGANGYEVGRYRAVFGGLAPAINPKFAIVVSIDEPSNGAYYSNQVAAPVFARIASNALRLYNVAPDIIDTHGVMIAQN